MHMITTSEITSSTKPFRFGIVGEFQSGKSLLINCLLRRSIATVGHGVATTHTIVNYKYSKNERIEYLTDDGVVETKSIGKIHDLDTRTDISVVNVYLTNELLKNFILTDMPGFGANENDTWAAKKTLPFIDFVILIQSNDTAMGANSISFRDFGEIKKLNIPYYLVLNCTNRDRWKYDDYDNINIAKTNLDLLDFKPIKYPLEEDGINIVNLMWYWFSICDSKDELINRPAYRNSFKEYGITPDVKKEVCNASNFMLINKIFNMENRAFLELERNIKEEVEKIKEELCPIGTIQAFAFERIPLGWLPCTGKLMKISELPDLYKAIGNVFGGNAKDGTFALPDLRSRFIRGNDENNNVGSIQEDTLQGHAHIVTSCSENGRHFHYVGYHDNRTQEANIGYTTYTHKDACDYKGDFKTGNYNTDHDGSHKHEIEIGLPISNTEYGEIRISDETRPKNITMQFCIKAQ